LQELSYVLRLARYWIGIVEQVVRYAVRFLDAQGALLALLGMRPAIPCTLPLRRHVGGATRPEDPGGRGGLVARSTGREHLELIRNSGIGAHRDREGLRGRRGGRRAAPVRHGSVIGTLIHPDPRKACSSRKTFRLLSTWRPTAAVVIANARFFEMVRRAKEQWETASTR